MILINCIKCDNGVNIKNKTILSIDDNKYPNVDIWKQILNTIDLIKKDYYREGLTLSYINIIDFLTKQNNECVFNIYDKEIDFSKIEGLYGELYISSNEIIFKLFESDILKTSNVYIINRNLSESINVDDFIKKDIFPLLKNINQFAKDIESRIDKRTNILDYYQTYCRELDFTQISLIKTLCQKIIDNCNKQLEGMSEKYTKI